MAGHLDLGNDGDVAGCRVGDDFPGVILREIAAIGIRIVFVGVPATAGTPLLPGCSLPPGGVVGQARVGLDLDAPAGVVGQVQVQAVEPHFGHRVDLFADEILVAEVPGDVEMDAAVGEARIIEHRAAAERVALARELRQGLPGVEDACFCIGFDADALAIDGQPIGFVAGEGGQAGRGLAKGLAAEGDFRRAANDGAFTEGDACGGGEDDIGAAGSGKKRRQGGSAQKSEAKKKFFHSQN